MENIKNKNKDIVDLFYMVLASLITIILGMSLYAWHLSTQINKLMPPKETLTEQIDWVFEDSVKNYIKELNIKHPDIVFRQAILESGNFQSAVFKDNNNMFGFKQAYKRPNVQKGTNRGYAVYDTWQECIIDYALYQTYSTKNMSKEQYILFLGRHYAEDPEYSNKISN